jgi:hypothetical protein
MAPSVPVRTVPPYVRFGSEDAPYAPTPAAEYLATTSTLQFGQSRWSDFMPATGGPPQRALSRAEVLRSKAIREEYHSKEDYGAQWDPTDKPTKQSRRPWWIQLVFRFFILFNSAVALGLGVGIYRHKFAPGCHRGGSTYMAIIVDTIAIPYTMYIAWDEFSSKPIGLRKPSSKLRLLLLDLIFIVLEGCNVSLASQSLSDDDFVCSKIKHCENRHTCDMQEGLVGVLVVAQVAWLATFIMSLTRLMNIAWDRN